MWDSSVSEILIPYGLKDGVLIHVSKVKSGLACNCICPACHEKLVAKKGESRQDHFAHYSAEPCSNALESTLHILAKEILAKEKLITLPAICIQFKPSRRVLWLEGPKAHKVDFFVEFLNIPQH